MTRLELLGLVIGHARSNGFPFRRWYTTRLARVWTGGTEALQTLCEEHRYYALLFSPEFARHFWKAGTRMTFRVETQEFARRGANGTVKTVVRKAYTRRMTREDAWRYHLREMAVSEEPLRYIRRFLPVAEELELEEAPTTGDQASDPRFIVDEQDLQSDEMDG